MDRQRLFVSVSHATDPSWRWIAHHLSSEYAWRFVGTDPKNVIERRVQRPYVARYRAAFQSAWLAKSEHADLLVSHAPALTSVTALGASLMKLDAPHLAFAFNFTTLPHGPRRELMSKTFQQVDRFVVPSTVERKLYSEHFELSSDKFDVLRWAVQKPHVPDGATPIIEGDYICAIGGEGRDYGTLMEAMRLLPQLRLVVVARPHNLAGLSVPDNVTAMANIPVPDAWNILKFSRFAVVPLRDSEVPCGHVTLVAAMHLGKALVITDSAGVADYVEHDVTALTCPPRDPASLAKRIQELWDSPQLTERLGNTGRAFAVEHCSEHTTAQYFDRYLHQKALALT